MKYLLFTFILFSFHYSQGQQAFFANNQSAVATPYTPNLVVTRELRAWYRSDTALQTSGANVNVWKDISGNNYHLAAASSAPQLTAAGVSFNGGQAFSANNVAINSPDVTVIMVVKKRGQTSLGIALEFGPNATSANYGFAIVHNEGSYDEAILGTPTGNHGRGVSKTVMDGVEGIMIASFNTSDASPETSIEFAGTLYTGAVGYPTADNTAYTYGTRNMYIGARNTSGLFCNMDVREIIVYGTKLTTTERSQLKSYLQSKYGL